MNSFATSTDEFEKQLSQITVRIQTCVLKNCTKPNCVGAHICAKCHAVNHHTEDECDNENNHLPNIHQKAYELLKKYSKNISEDSDARLWISAKIYDVLKSEKSIQQVKIEYIVPFNNEFHVAGAVLLTRIQDKLHILMQKRSKSAGGYISFPGGKINKGENHHIAALRELKEESGFSIESGGSFEWLEDLNAGSYNIGKAVKEIVFNYKGPLIVPKGTHFKECQLWKDDIGTAASFGHRWIPLSEIENVLMDSPEMIKNSVIKFKKRYE